MFAEPRAITSLRGDRSFRLAVNIALAHIYRCGRIGAVLRAWFDQVGARVNSVVQVVHAFGALQD